jgi:hypothetical protein
MFEKVTTARMNNRENSSTERLIASARQLRGKHAPLDHSSRFASYLRLFGSFFELSFFESIWGAAPFLPRCCRRSSTAQAHVAFL